MRYLISFLLLSLSSSVWAASLRIEEDRAWLKADGAPLSKVLFLFEQRGVDVLIDPALDMGRITGEWDAVKVERLVSQLAHPHSYSVEWSRVASPLGELDQLASIRIFSDGNADAARKLTRKSKTLDVVTGEDGLKHIRGEIMVGFDEGSTMEDLNTLLTKIGGTVVEVIEPPGIYRIKLSDDISVAEALELVSAHDGVKAGEPNRAYENLNPPVDLTANPGAVNLNLQPGEKAIAVFDSGLDPTYADLPVVRGAFNAVDPGAEVTDPSGHGTLVSLIASGTVAPAGAEAPLEGVTVVPIMTFDANGMTSSDTIMRGINYAINSDVKIINMSFGTYEDVGFLEDAINYAAAQGVVVYVASGNDGLERSVNPAASPYTISVGATNPDGSIAAYSNHGSSVNIYRTGTVQFGGKTYYGTSFASPYAAFEAAR